ncbi:MAG TPA: hypothetical protein VI758_13490, partial [Bacteroidota bacterium]
MSGTLSDPQFEEGDRQIAGSCNRPAKGGNTFGQFELMIVERVVLLWCARQATEVLPKESNDGPI